MKMHVDNVDGYAKNSYEDTGTIVDGILAQATSNERELTKHLWDQKLHSLTHTLVVSGRCDLKKSDILAYEEKAYLVLAVDNAGDLGFQNRIITIFPTLSEIQKMQRRIWLTPCWTTWQAL